MTAEHIQNAIDDKMLTIEILKSRDDEGTLRFIEALKEEIKDLKDGLNKQEEISNNNNTSI